MVSPDPTSSGLLASEKAGDNAPAQSVGELSAALKRTVEGAFGNVRVRGEISGWKRAASGHCYFALKDEDAVIDAVLWRGQAQRLAFAPEDGAEVVATGKLTTYPGRSKYQVVVNSLELAGEGALMALLEKRKKQLAAEGLFDAARKQELPYLPKVIGVVTSPTGAVIRDILHRLHDRCPTRVILWPVQVQGESAAGQVAAAINGFDAMTSDGPVPRPDLLIVARGGGSIEDLWAFNEEVVVRAAAACSIPLISAVGHETDTTLIDYVSDKRAPTPTAAAEMAVPVLAELRGWIGEQGERAAGALRRQLDRMAERQQSLTDRWPAPTRLVEEPTRRLDEMSRRLQRGLVSSASSARGDLAGIAGRLDRRLIDQAIDRRAERLTAQWDMAKLVHPDRPLSRGYARVTAGDSVVTTAKQASAADALTLHFGDGTADVVPAGKTPPSAPVAPRRKTSYRAPKTPEGQRGLFDTGDNGDA
ncbi:exodeoxyribonuclease VII large subunit [Sphingomicrobium sediminis]|uniref:Exodeoxyribonuclease 7 large subunit n=1 Tax=Sphingomicrobium sediminis TaxID=2950949 RepID=A0A9X2J529_9SPHN|nr:exodeoxyribonuclease VII large subunit [Sphingomicrobium sediminis]MCM8557832.1 exodeoxyribonuclease VII large subunit [Sphingomicrobium sediminis]